MPTFAAIERDHALIRTVSAERVRDEVARILTEGGARRGFELLDESGLLAVILPEVAAMKGVEQPPEYHPEGDVWAHTLLLLEGLRHPTLTLALLGGLPVTAMAVLCVLKLAATVTSYSSGGSGGIFAPALFMGGMLGGAVGYLDVTVFHHPADSIGAFAVVGMGAVFAGIVRAPMTSILIIFEMTGGYGLVLPLMIANMSAFALARHWRHTPVYEALLMQDGIDLEREAASISENQRAIAKTHDADELSVDARS